MRRTAREVLSWRRASQAARRAPDAISRAPLLLRLRGSGLPAEDRDMASADR